MALRGARRLLGRGCADESGQMTIEFMAMLPVMIAVACIGMNAVTFFSECAAFDIQAKNAIRTYASSPGYGQDTQVAVGKIATALESSFCGNALNVSVEARNAGSGMTTYDATLSYAPNLFGMGLRDSVLGVSLPRLHHTASLTVRSYKPGMLF